MCALLALPETSTNLINLTASLFFTLFDVVSKVTCGAATELLFSVTVPGLYVSLMWTAGTLAISTASGIGRCRYSAGHPTALLMSRILAPLAAAQSCRFTCPSGSILLQFQAEHIAYGRCGKG